MMNPYIINWFRINNWHELNFRYRLVEVTVDGAGEDSKEFHRGFFNAMNHLAHETKGPVAEGYHAGKRHIAVRAGAELKTQYISGSPLNILLSPVAGEFFLNAKTMDEKNLQLALKFLESSVNWQFNANQEIWEGGNFTFLKKWPLYANGNAETEIYPGFRFKIVAENKNNVYFCVDLAFRYTDKRTLDEQLKLVPPERHTDFINGRNFLYRNGDNWYTVKGKSVGKSISQHLISAHKGNISVYDYITKEGKFSQAKIKQPLPACSATFFHSYFGNTEKTVSGAACLAKRIRMPEDDMHRFSINAPNKRFSGVEFYIKKYFKGLTFNGVLLQVDARPVKKTCKVFPLPGLLYGRNARLNPYETGRQSYGHPLDSFPRRRREFIYNFGILNNNPFTAQHVFFPDNIDFEFGKAVKTSFETWMKKIAPRFPTVTLHAYKMKSAPYAHMVYADLKEYIEKNAMRDSSILFILPDQIDDGGRFVRDLHHLVKKELFDTVKIKCVAASKLKSFFHAGVDSRNPLAYAVPPQLAKSFRSYFFNTLFEILIINRKWPFALSKKLNNDLYIGIDAHEFYAGFCFFFGNGEKIVFEIDKTTKGVGSHRNEKINYKIIADKIVTVLERHLAVSDEKPRSIIILRDGISFGEEQKALDIALARLEEKKLILKSEVCTGVINIAKSSAIPVRAAGLIDNGQSLINPDCGMHFYMNSHDAFIFNTGYPYQVPGSSNPLHVSWASGNIDFDKTLEDVFILSQITFSAPDRPSSNVLPLKLIDTLIRDVAHDNDFVAIKHKEAMDIKQPKTQRL